MTRWGYIFRREHEANALREAAESINGLGEKLESISQAEIKSKDRVDITLSEYLNMKDELKNAHIALKHAHMLLMTMGIPPEIISAIDQDSVHVYTNEDIRDFKRHYQIKFSVDTSRFI